MIADVRQIVRRLAGDGCESAGKVMMKLVYGSLIGGSHNSSHLTGVVRQLLLGMTVCLIVVGAATSSASANGAVEAHPRTVKSSQSVTDGHLGAAPAGIEQYIRHAMRDWGVPGLAIAVVKDDRIIYAQGFGVRDLETRQPVDADTVFPIGSVTKSMTATAVA